MAQFEPLTERIDRIIAEEAAKTQHFQPFAPLPLATMQPEIRTPVDQTVGRFTPLGLKNVPLEQVFPQSDLPPLGTMPHLTPSQPQLEEKPESIGQRVLEGFTGAFEWIQDNLERPWAEVISAPLRGDEEYESWREEHGFLGGVLEFTMPLWWLPYFGWAAKGAGVIPRVGGSVAKGIKATEATIGKIITKPFEVAGKSIIRLPPIQKLRKEMFFEDRWKIMAEKMATIPGMRAIVGAVNPSALTHGAATEGKVILGGYREMSAQAVNVAVADLTRIVAEPAKLFGLDDLGRFTTKAGERVNWWDVASQPTKYASQLTTVQNQYVKRYGELIDELVKMAEEGGVKLAKKDFAEGFRYIPRIFENKEGLLDLETGIFRPLGTVSEPEKWIATRISSKSGTVKKVVELGKGAAAGGARVGAKPFFTRSRFYEFAEDSLQAGLRPGRFLDPNITFETFAKGIYKLVTDKAVSDVWKPLGRTINQMVPQALRVSVAHASIRYRAIRQTEAILQRAIRQEKVPTQTIAALERRFAEVGTPEIATELRTAMSAGRAEMRALAGRMEIQRKAAWKEFVHHRAQRNLAREAARGTPGWHAIGQPFAANRLFPEEVATEINKMLADRAIPAFTKVSNLNAMARFMVTGFDFGAGFIQGIPLLMANPVRWGKAMNLMFRSFTDPKVRARYLMEPENIAVLNKLMPEGLLIGNSEFMEAATAGGLIAKLPAPFIKVTGVRQFVTSFNTFGDVARIEWAKALLPGIERSGGSLRELTAFINKATGVMSSRALGIGATQRQIEGAMLLFAPRYFRATVGLWADMIRGGLRGELARKSLGHMMAGGFFFYYGLTKALNQEPNLDPTSGKFLTVKIGDSHVGFGSAQVAMFRMIGNIFKTATEDPQGFVKLNSRDNPLIRFVRSRVSPLSGVTWDVITGKTFIGEPLDDIETIVEEELLGTFMPFWMANLTIDQPTPGKVAIGAALGESFGMRAWPLQVWEHRDELRDNLAREEFGKPWYTTDEEAGINRGQKKVLEQKFDELRRFSEEADRIRLERGGVEDVVWNSFKIDRERARTSYDDKLNAIQLAYDSGRIDGYKFRTLAQEAGTELRGAYENIEENPLYADIQTYLNQPLTLEQIQRTPIEDVAFDHYTALMFADDLELPTGEYRYDLAEQRRQVFIAQWGEDIYNYVREVLSFGKNVPPLMQEYYKAVDILRPYWKIRDDVIAQWGEPRTASQSRRVDMLISRMRQRLRKIDPRVAFYYNLFYRRT